MYEEGDSLEAEESQTTMGNMEENPGRTGQVLFVWDRAESPAWRDGPWVKDGHPDPQMARLSTVFAALPRTEADISAGSWPQLARLQRSGGAPQNS
ncbi:unnamed protein product [Fusarium graminearum]|uniref:Chromosome 2, complete genome n=1 Tax=Gibberella zeae (strain ATCC MYA-4620 / CBS 123657 / FGSC 9075 / NRRL 31084 / PH-1) TaxID=229533 RepID=A0A0E0S6Z6_GIBZE|nr:hypothetical protein FG05_30445 [Fusarium graminearum]CEF79271.1 unnamed protein product [Fusarium graminearum]CZS82553.1 unnamed protein product [Fusarium graminearum]